MVEQRGTDTDGFGNVYEDGLSVELRDLPVLNQLLRQHKNKRRA